MIVMTRHNFINRRFICLLPILFLFACDHTPASDLPVTSMQIGSQKFSLEIATKPHDQEVGLMHRDTLDSDHGMIFVFPDEDMRTFWNHDVHFPLDLLFVDARGNIVSIKQMPKYSDVNCSSDFPAKYVIELNDGTAKNLSLAPGQHLTIPSDALNPPATTTPATSTAP
jgi:uncharacterized protein